MQNSKHKPLVGFAGMTHLGIVMAATTAARGYDVIGYHNKPIMTLPREEPGLDELIKGIGFTNKPEEMSYCDLVFVTLDVPLNKHNQPDFEPVRGLINDIIPYLKDDAVLVIMSQVPPGFTQRVNFPKERLFYQVETLIFGESVTRATLPERIIIGCAEPSNLPRVYHDFLRGFGCPLLPMRYESAELSKIAINTMLIAQLSATNVLAELCEEIGADWYDIISVLRSDERIGTYLTPGLGVGGGHIERDLHTLLYTDSWLAESSGWLANEHLIHAFLSISRGRQRWLIDKVEEKRESGLERIAILGLSYKPGTASTINSAGMALLTQLEKENVVVYDPIVKDVRSTDSVFECIKGVDILVIATPWPAFFKIKIMDLQLQMHGRVIIDPYRVLNNEEAILLGFEYHTLGAPPKYPDRETL